MSPAPTESRIFAERYRREARRLEKLHCNRLSPGTEKWGDASHGISKHMRRVVEKGGPIKAAAVLRQAGDYLFSTQQESMHFVLNAYSTKRAAALVFAAQDFSSHPLVGVETEDGVNIKANFIESRRNGDGRIITGLSIGYISRHAIERMHEREEAITLKWANASFAMIGMLGHMLRDSDKHADRGLCLSLGDTLAIGTFREAVGAVGDSAETFCRFFDVRTALPIAEVEERNPELANQGRLTASILHHWVVKDKQSPDSIPELTQMIPDLTPREDYAIRVATKVRVEGSALLPVETP